MFEDTLMSLLQGQRIITRSRSKPYRPNRRIIFPQLRKQLSPIKMPKNQLTSLTELIEINQSRSRRIANAYTSDNTALRVVPMREMMIVASKVGRTKNQSMGVGKKFETSKSASTYAEEELILNPSLLHESHTADGYAEEKKQGQHHHTHQSQQPSHMKNRLYHNMERYQSIRHPKLPQVYYYSILNGNNNESLIKQIIQTRSYWKPFDKATPGLINLKWQSHIENFKFKKLQNHSFPKMINHFECHHQISTKNCLIRNLQIYCESRKTEIFGITPITFVVDFDDEYCEYNMRQFLGFFLGNLPKKVVDDGNGGTNTNSNNHSSGNGNTSLSSQQYKAMNQFVRDFMGYMSWQGSSQVRRQVNPLSKPVLTSCYTDGDGYIWLLKPTGLNRGRGIEIFNSLDKLKQILLNFMSLNNRKKFLIKRKPSVNKNISNTIHQSDSEINSPPPTLRESEDIPSQRQPSTPIKQQQQQPLKSHEAFRLTSCSFVIQKYIERPLLIDSRKFDIRVWVLLRQDMNLYFFKQGYLRMSSEKYSLNISNYFVHLTNNAVQQHSENYGNYESGNQLSFGFLKDFLKELGTSSLEIVVARMKQLCYMSMSSVRSKINPHRRKHCFEVFGYDFILDSSCKVWLIEVNTNPCIETSSPLLKMLIPRMLNDAFRLTVDQLFPRPQKQKQKAVTQLQQQTPTMLILESLQNPEKKLATTPSPPVTFPVTGYTDTENMWQCLGKLSPNSQYKKQDTTTL